MQYSDRAVGADPLVAAEVRCLAEQLVRADPDQRVSLLAANAHLIDLSLVYAVHECGYNAWDDDPTLASEAAAVLDLLTQWLSSPEASATAVWMRGIAALSSGQLDDALRKLAEAALQFQNQGQALMAARVQVGRMVALGLLGLYDEALSCGLAIREVLLQHHDEITAGRVELNLGHLAFRRDRYDEAELYYQLAYHRFSRTTDQALLASVENALADVLVRKQDFAQAQALYEQALQRATNARLGVIQALTECNLGNLALAQGRYDQALAYLEQSRRHYAALEMPHESAYADLELAEAYLELNLVTEAYTILNRVTPLFASLGMRAEEAWSLTLLGQAVLAIGQIDAAQQHFQAARHLFAAEDNSVGIAQIALCEAHLHYRTRQFALAATLAAEAEAEFRASRDHLRRLFAAWLRGEILRAAGLLAEAEDCLQATLREAEQYALPQMMQRCATALGLLAADRHDLTTAEMLLTRAIELIEALRAPLPAEEFRMAFVADKLVPFQAMVRICLETGREAEALSYVERARARALVEMLGGAAVQLFHPRDAFEQHLVTRLNELRQQLNWCYQQLIQLPAHKYQSSVSPATLQSLIQHYETAILELTRQFRQRDSMTIAGPAFDLGVLQSLLDPGTAIVIYYSLDDEVVAWIVDREQVQIARHLATPSDVETLVDRLRFQLDAMRRVAGRSGSHADLLLQRVRHYLRRLYDALVRPFADAIAQRQRLVFVPHGVLHYVPLQALFDGQRYLIEQFDVCVAPSAAVIQHCIQQPSRGLARGVFVGVPDDHAPRVRDEVLTIARLWPDRMTLLDEAATVTAVQQSATEANVLHLACHGVFRLDNPLFSGLRLADGRLTVLDIYRLRLSCDLVVLSACETGLSLIAPGDELIGLTRGFLAAGASSVVVSLWTVDDATTAQIMTDFYTLLRAGVSPAAALRQAQLIALQTHPHPFFWAAFALIGRW